VHDRVARAGDLRDLPARLVVDDQVRIDSGMCPVAQCCEIGDLRHDGYREVAAGAHPAEDLGRAGVRRHDHVGSMSCGQPLHHGPAGQRSRPLDDGSRRGERRDQEVLRREQPRQAAQHGLCAGPGSRLEDAARLLDRVYDDCAGAARLERVGEQPCRKIVTRADVGRNDEHAHADTI
jgi:hypothetical protein